MTERDPVARHKLRIRALDCLVGLQNDQADPGPMAKPGISLEVQCFNGCRSGRRRVAHGYIIAPLPAPSEPSRWAKNDVPFDTAGNSIS